MSESIPVIAAILYLLISIALTVWVGRTLFANGRIFLHKLLGEDETLTDAVNTMLLVGFYLVNIGTVALFLSEGARPTTLLQLVEFLSGKVGTVLLILGVMHFGNMFMVWFVSWVRAGGVHRNEPPDEIATLKASQ